MTAHSAQSPAGSGVAPKARLSSGTCTTRTWSSSDRAIAAHSQRLVNRPRKALTRSERELKQLNSWASTSTVKPAVRASVSPAEPSISPPGQLQVDHRQRGQGHH